VADLSDDELMEMFRGGDVEAFDVLFDRYHAPVYSFARFMLNSSTGAEEIMQETLLAVARAAKSYEARGRFRAWIMGIVRYRCLAALESERARRAVIEGSAIELVDPASSEPPPPERIVRDERAAVVRRAISELPDRQREAIVLYAFEDMAYREIAEALGAPINTVKTLIHRARAGLARVLRESGGETGDEMGREKLRAV
jgi:RNA polymerase sigma-70 factor (ECF subfamily)